MLFYKEFLFGPNSICVPLGCLLRISDFFNFSVAIKTRKFKGTAFQLITRHAAPVAAGRLLFFSETSVAIFFCVF